MYAKIYLLFVSNSARPDRISAFEKFMGIINSKNQCGRPSKSILMTLG